MCEIKLGCYILRRWAEEHVLDWKLIRISNRHKLLLYTLAIPIAGFILLISLRQLPSAIGRGDFRAYWSTSYLLFQGQNCADDSLLLDIQNSKTGWPRDYPMRIWNPPWVTAWFLPLAFLNFQLATRIWLLINITLVLMCIFLSWRMFIDQAKDKRRLWLLALGAILFPSTIVAIFMGQVNLLVLAGLVLFLWLTRNGHDIGAGVALSLTMVKPHLIYLALPIILLAVLMERRWIIILGFGASLFFSLAIVFFQRTSFIQECLTITGSSNLSSWQTPTLTTFLQVSLGLWWMRIIGLFLMPIAVLLWLHFRDSLSFLIMLDLAIIVSVITSPFGWSYDFVVLLLPLMHLWSWLLTGKFNRLETLLLVVVTVSMYLIYYYQRVQTPNEMYFFWLPMIIGGLYFWTLRRLKDRKLAGTVCIFEPLSQTKFMQLDSS